MPVPHRLPARAHSTRRACLAAVALLVLAAGCGSDDGGSAGLPDLQGSTPPTAYRVVYEVTTPDGRGTEEHVVHRPFEAHVLERDADGEVVTERWSGLGILATRGADQDPVAIGTALAPAAGDARPDRFVERLTEAGRLRSDGDGHVGGRACHRSIERSTVATDPGTGAGSAELGSFPVVTTRCVDDRGIILEEEIVTPGGERLRTRRAVELVVGDDVPAVELPDATPLPVTEGGGTVEELPDDAPPAFTEVWAIDAPARFTSLGRFAVTPARLTGTGAAAGAPTVSLHTEAWSSGPDLLLLDQGTSSGSAPFDPATEVGPVELAEVGTATLAVDLRLAEVRLLRPGGGFVRVAGTLPLEDLLAVARTLHLVALD